MQTHINIIFRQQGKLFKKIPTNKCRKNDENKKHLANSKVLIV